MLGFFSADPGNSVEIDRMLEKVKKEAENSPEPEKKYLKKFMKFIEESRDLSFSPEIFLEKFPNLIREGLVIYPDSLDFQLAAARMLQQFSYTTEAMAPDKDGDSMRNEVRDIVRKLLKMHPDEEEVYLIASDVLTELSEKERIALLEQCLQLNPESPSCREQKKRLTQLFEEPYCTGEQLSIDVSFRPAYAEQKENTKAVKIPNDGLTIFVEEKGAIGNHDIATIREVQEESGLSVKTNLSIELRPESHETFSNLTRRLIGEYLTVYLDNKIVMAPMVQTEIIGGRIMITPGVGEMAMTLKDICEEPTVRKY